jgi:hypothetical protein
MTERILGEPGLERKRRMRLFPLLVLLSAIMLIGVSQASGAFGAPTPDVDGANDVPGQKDLSSQNVDYAGLPNTIITQWNWDELKTSGNNTLDACSLLDSDSPTNGFADFAVCGTTKGTAENPIVTTTTLYSCGDTRADRCSSQLGIIPSPPALSSCTSAVSATDPFGGQGKARGANYPDDLQATCNLVLDDFGVAVNTLVLINTCSYPSQQPNSDPSDCVLKTIPFTTPTLSTTPDDTFSVTLTDSLDLTNALAGGTATFILYASLADCQNSANALFTDPDVTVTGGKASTAGMSFSPTVDTTYHWLVTYSGDLTNHLNPNTTLCGDETTKVTVPVNDGV